MNLRRALLAVALHLLIVVLFTTNFLAVVAPVVDVTGRDTVPKAIRTTIVPTSRIVIGVIAAFIAGWWGTRGLAATWIKQGLLIGALIAAFGLLLVLGGISAGADVILLGAAVAAVAGAGVTTLHARYHRALIAAALQVLGTSVLFLALIFVFWVAMAAAGAQVYAATVPVVHPYWPLVGRVVGIGTAFLAGWWGTRAFTDQAVEQGATIGVLVVAFWWLWSLVLARPLGLLNILFFLPAAAAAIAGAMFARSRHRAS